MPEDNSYQSNLYKSILSETGEKNQGYELLENKVTVFFRPDDRTKKGTNCYLEDIEGISFVGLISEKGSHQTEQLPKFEWLKPIKINKRFATEIIDLEGRYYEGSYSHIIGIDSLIICLRDKYPEQEIDEDSTITVCVVEYC